MKKGFTLVELVIVIVIVGILSIVAVPIYRGYVEKAQLTEAMALLGAIKTAQSVYYAEHGQWYTAPGGDAGIEYDAVLGVDARANKYFPFFATRADSAAGYWNAQAFSEDEVLNTYWNADLNAPKLPQSGRYFWKKKDGSFKRF